MADLLANSSIAARSASTGEVVFRTHELTKRYGQRLAVNNLSMEVRRGEIFGFLGPNGAGKTTTIRMALGLITPTSGSIEIFGQDFTPNRAQLLPRVGALIETPALHPYLSGRDNLRALAPVLGGVSEARMDELLDLVGLKARQKERAKTYSLGMKQRLGVAIALLNNPDFLILDEPANGLDPAGVVEIRDLMRTLASQGKTIFISSHVLGEVQQLCTRIAIVNLGQLITESTVDALTKNNGEFLLTIEGAEKVLPLIQAQPWGQTAHLDAKGAIITPSPNGLGRGLIRFLTGAGIYPDGLGSHQESLEDVFLRLTNADHGKVL